MLIRGFNGPEAMKTVLQTYCQSTTLHGFFYLADPKRRKIEKLFWLMMMFVSVTCLFLLLQKLAIKIEKNPIVLYQSDVPLEVNAIPFPAFSLCPRMEPFKSGSFYRFKELFENGIKLNGFQKSVLEQLNGWQTVAEEDKLSLLNISIPFTELYFQDIFNSIFRNTVVENSWMQIYLMYYSKTFMSEGMCFTFNMIEPEDLFHLDRVASHFNYKRTLEIVDTFVEKKYYNESYPWKTSNKNLGVNAFVWDESLYLENFASGDKNIKIIIHSPYEMPSKHHPQHNLEIDEISSFLVSVYSKMVEDIPLDANPDVRCCYFDNEKELYFFKVYTVINCRLECASLFVLDQCDCVPYYMMRDDETLICTINKKLCYDEALKAFNENFEKTCKCYPPCEVFNYIIERQKVDYTGELINNYDKDKVGSEFRIRFKDGEFYPLVLKKVLSKIDIFSYIGGVLSLFLGFSMLSVVEIIHILIIKLIMTKKPTAKVSNISKAKRVSRGFKQRFMEYMEESSIHGFSYIADVKMTFVERSIWAASFMASMTGCIFIIWQLYQKLGANAIAMVFDDGVHDVSSIDFPAVTFFGNYNKVDFNELYSSDDPEAIFVLAVDCLMTSQARFAAILMDGYKDYEDRIVGRLKVKSRLNWFLNQSGEWNEFYHLPFAEVLSSRGFGFSFNILDLKTLLRMDQVSTDFHYEKNLTLRGKSQETKPLKTFRASSFIDETLRFDMVVERDRTDYLREAFLVHSSAELPLFLDKEDVIEFKGGKSIEVLIIPTIIMTDQDLKSLKISERMCFMEDEKYLRFFNIYSKRNCEIECFSNNSVETCGCAPFDVIRDQQTKVCGIEDVECVEELQREIKYGHNIEMIASCNCLQPCDSISYNIETIESRFDESFKDSDFVPLRRYRQFRIIDFCSYAGGILGLFAGISVLSFFEIFYFFVIRVLVSFYKPKEINKFHHRIIKVKPIGLFD